MQRPSDREAADSHGQQAAAAMLRPGPGGFGGPGMRGRGGPVVKPNDFRGTMGRLWRYFGKERARLAVVFVIILINSAIMLLGPYLIGMAIDAMTSGAGGTVDFSVLKLAVIALVGAYAADSGLSLVQATLAAGAAQRVVASLRRALFDKLHTLPVGYFDSRRHGEVMSRLSNDIDNVSMTISQSMTQLMGGAIAIAGSLIMMLMLSPLLTLASLITVPLVFGLARIITKRTGVLFKEQQAQLGKLNGHVEESISGLELVQAFGREERVIREFEEVNERLYQVGLKAQIWSGFMMPLLAVINNLGFAAVAIVGGILAVKGMITVGVIAAFLSYSRQFVRPLNELANIYNVFQSGVAGAERAFEVLDEREEKSDPPGAVAIASPRGEVVFDNVGFGYRPDVPVLSGVSFRAEAGSRTAFVGPTGAGKTTVVNLLTRFYDVTEGRITIDGLDIRDYTRDSLRRCFGIVLQDTYLFSGTIRDNIKYGKPDATDEEIIAAAVMANADPFIRRLPQAYDTVLTENGGSLSQGQRQLLAIARVFLAKPSILILDEATSSIDTRTEQHIQEALLRVMQGRTSFIIAHRLNTIRDADQILVIDQGGVAERGSHEQLMSAGGKYAHMFENQFKSVRRSFMSEGEAQR
ncbi:ABC transporter ATP-binding protein [Paenibacillus chartarius]|uniref:ABC transporter ATP-binding protein n=1 Tax=Paenibacillus chartarius TaxID=747481 RepID=A0ABV6DTI1_9BACL